MTREEAIKVLQTESIELGGSAPSVCRFWKALDMAVKALEDVTDKNVGKMTNADRIRAMSDEELVNWIADINPFYCQTCVYAKPCRLEYDVETVNYAEKYDCKDGILKWLQQPVED